MTSNFKLQPDKLYSVHTLSKYEIFTDNLYSILQDIDQLVSINNKDDSYRLYYTSYEHLDEDTEFNGSTAKNNSELKKVCNIILSALKGEIPMPIIEVDSTNNEFLSSDNNNLIFFFNAIKDNEKRDMLYEKMYSHYTPGDWLNSLKYIDKNLENTKEEIIDYLFEKAYQKETPKQQLRFLKSLLSVPEMNVVVKHRDDILQILENCYSEFLDFDKHQDSEPKSYVYISDSPRSFVDGFLASQESIDNWYLYQKFTSNGKFINESVAQSNLFEVADFTLEPMKINHKVLMNQYPTLINKTLIRTMLNDVVKSLSYGGGIPGVSKVGDIYSPEDHESIIFIKIDNIHDKNEVLNNVKKILPNMFEFYQSTIAPMGPKAAEHEKEKLFKQALSTFILDTKIPNKDIGSNDTVKRRKI